MSDLIGSVANLTGYRDRDLIDSTFVSVLSDWLDPLRLSLFRCVGDVADLRLLLPEADLPIRLHECRTGFRGHKGSYATNLTGLAVRMA